MYHVSWCSLVRWWFKLKQVEDKLKEKLKCHITAEETLEPLAINIFTKRPDNLNARLLHLAELRAAQKSTLEQACQFAILQQIL